MKTGILTWIVLGGCCLAACSDNDDDQRPKTLVEQAFEAKYPGATEVDWENYGKYSKVDFLYQGTDSEAWFYRDGAWLLTESEIAYSALPAVITQAVSTGKYSSWIPETDAIVFQQSLIPILYIVEVKKANEDRDIYYDEEGQIRKEVVEDYGSENLPSWMKSSISKEYPQAMTIEAEKLLDGMYTAYLLNGSKMGTMWFTAANQWWYTAWPIEEKEVPAAVLKVLEGEAYRDFSIQSVEYRDTPERSFYRFMLGRTGSMSIHVNVSPQGHVIPD